ncbi:hypothetical protein ACFOWU_12770 [Epilithonimonas zeae]|uniref:AraC family transcriptional regulator n=1 Tax=Epilithonimonas zeae TaxID=1416779 RepID=A0A1N6J030_9FLAO|nr:hypothetical protein [Epilithonimonas zeae]SIO37603.1 hypothetical protein SAMN05444409_3173 [Epilithonimonas zeae]
MNKPTLRKNEIAEKYLTFLDRHIDDVIKGKEQEFFRIKHIASTLAASHTHFTDTIKKVLGKYPCFFYDEKIIKKLKICLGKKICNQVLLPKN